MISDMPILYEERNAEVGALITQMLEFPRSDHDDMLDATVQAILYLRQRQEFDSSFETWRGEVDLLTAEFDPEDEPDPRMRNYVPARDGVRGNLYAMSPAQRHKWLRDQSQREAEDVVDPAEIMVDLEDVAD